LTEGGTDKNRPGQDLPDKNRTKLPRQQSPRTKTNPRVKTYVCMCVHVGLYACLYAIIMHAYICIVV